VTDHAAHGGAGPPLALSLALLLGVFASLVTAPGAEGLYGAFLAAQMLVIAVYGARHYLIPNELTGAAFALALLRAGAVVPTFAPGAALGGRPCCGRGAAAAAADGALPAQARPRRARAR
jgi:leader peptidase (prepilin peptidase)/N-methyltransferase